MLMPDIGASDDAAPETMVIVLTSIEVPQEPTTVYDTTEVPTAMPVTSPPTTVTFELLLLHEPPGVPSVSVTELPTQTVAGPDIELEPDDGLMVMSLVA